MEQDLHTLLSSVRDDAPPPRLSVDDITTAGRHLARRRRRLAVLSSVGGGAAAAVAAVTAALMLATSPGTPLTPAVDPSALANAPASPAAAVWTDAPPFVTTYRGYQAGHYTVSDPDVVTRAYQQSSIETPSGPDVSPEPTASAPSPAGRARAKALRPGGALVVYRQSAFDPAVFSKTGSRFTSSGLGGYLLYSGGPSGPTLSPGQEALLQKMQPRVPTIAWQYAPDSWAAIYWSSWETVPGRDELMALVGGLAPAAPKKFPVGFEPGYVPKGFQLLSVSFGADLDTGDAVVSAARLTPKVPDLPLDAPYEFDSLPTLTMSTGHTDAGAKLVDRLDCAEPALSCNRVVGDGTVYVQADLDGLKPADSTMMSKVTLALKPHNGDDMAGWPAATEVFPYA